MLYEVITYCAEVDTGRRFWDVEEAMEVMANRAATSGGTLSYAFSTSVYAKLVEGWNEEVDTTRNNFV